MVTETTKSVLEAIIDAIQVVGINMPPPICAIGKRNTEWWKYQPQWCVMSSGNTP